MTETLLGLIALGTLTTAVLQIVVMVGLLRAGKRALTRVQRISDMVAPLPAHLESIRVDVERMKDVAAGQASRVAAFYDVVAPPIQKGMTALAIIRTVTGFVRKRR